MEKIDAVWRDLRFYVAKTNRWVGSVRRHCSRPRQTPVLEQHRGYNISTEDAIAAIKGDRADRFGDGGLAGRRQYRHAMTYVLQLSDDGDFSYSSSTNAQSAVHDDRVLIGSQPGKMASGFDLGAEQRDQGMSFTGMERELVPGSCWGTHGDAQRWRRFPPPACSRRYGAPQFCLDPPVQRWQRTDARAACSHSSLCAKLSRRSSAASRSFSDSRRRSAVLRRVDRLREGSVDTDDPSVVVGALL